MTLARRYIQTEQETASPQRLMVLLFQKAIAHIYTSAEALEAGNLAVARPLLLKASDIVMHLHATLDSSQAPALCDQLGALYRFTALRLTRASWSGEAKLVREAERVFRPIAEAFEKAVALAGGAT